MLHFRFRFVREHKTMLQFEQIDPNTGDVMIPRPPIGTQFIRRDAFHGGPIPHLFDMIIKPTTGAQVEEL